MDLKIINNKDSTNKQLVNYYCKLNFLSNLLGLILKTERNMIQSIVLVQSQESNFQNRCNDKKSVFWFLKQIFNIILNFLNQVLRFKIELKKSTLEFDENKKLDIEINNLFFQNIENLIKSGEMKHCKSYISQICSKWFYKNFSLNAALETAESSNFFMNKNCFEYFENMFKDTNTVLSQPLSLKDLCRIEIKYHVKNYPKDLDIYDSILPNYIKKYIRYKN